MSLLVRHAICRLLLAVVVGVALLGDGLHYLPGAGHAAHPEATQHSGARQAPADRLSAGCHHHGCHHAQAASDAAPAEHSAPHDECQICRFLALAQCDTRVPIALPYLHGCEYRNQLLPLHISPRAVAACLARAPPRPALVV